MILFETIRWKNFLSTGNHFTEISFNSHATTLIVGNNGAGKLKPKTINKLLILENYMSIYLAV